MHLSHVVETIDTHTAGNPTRNLIAGVPRIEGKTMQDKMAYAGEPVSYTHLDVYKRQGLFRFLSQLDVAGNANHAERRIVFRVVQCLDGFKVYPFPVGIQHLFLADQGIEFSPHDLKVVLNKFLSGIS